MDALEELRRNREARVNNIQKGFASEEMDIQKAQVGEHRNFQGKDYVWTEFAPGKFGWRRPKDGHAAAQRNAPQPSKSAPQQNQEPDFTPKIPKEIASLTNRSSWEDFEDAYRAIGAEIVKEKYQTPVSIQKYIQSRRWKGIETQEDMERHLGLKEVGGNNQMSKTAQIAAMKKYYEDKASRAKEAYQEKKNADYWAGAGAKRKAEIEQERQEQLAIRKKAVNDAINEVQTLFGKNTGYNLNVNLSDYGSYKLGVSVDGNRTWDSMTLEVERDIFGKNDEFETELRHSSMNCDFNNPDEVKQAKNLFYCGNLIIQHADKIKDILIKHGATYADAGKKLNELNAELKQNH